MVQWFARKKNILDFKDFTIAIKPLKFNLQELNSKSSNTSDVYKRFSCFGSKINQNQIHYANKTDTEPSGNYTTNGAFE